MFRRGNPKTPGPEVPRAFLTLLTQGTVQPFQHGSGRLELARQVISRDNPLTARVLVNRVWAWHFGQGLVRTPSDFGVRADIPSHPDLLDWLAARFMEHGWSLKYLHRLILSSAAWQQQSSAKTSHDTQQWQTAGQVDPENRLLWRMMPHRLTFEEYRDAVLLTSGQLDRTAYGRPVDLLTGSRPARRSVYGFIDRRFFPGVLRVFDVANPDMHVAQRRQTTVPQQALFFMNHPFVLQCARELSATSASPEGPQTQPTAADDRQRVVRLFQQVLQREPTEAEIQESLAFVDTARRAKRPAVRPQVLCWSYLYGQYDEAEQRVGHAVPLPHFTGSAWQGGHDWPDSRLGWVRLTAQGGHPGNDLKHACIRRWTAPADMTVDVRSAVHHDAQPGDGIRAFIVHSTGGCLASAAVHSRQVALDVSQVDVRTGDTLDFIVDIGDGLGHDQFRWHITLSDVAESTSDETWDSENDFHGPVEQPLTPWEQLTHVLLCSNEFQFVD